MSMLFHRPILHSWLPTWVVGIFFGVLLVIGLLLHPDYGVSSDEPNNHLNGLVNAKHIAQLIAPELLAREPNNHLIPTIKAYHDADHGAAFELPVAVLCYFFTPDDSQAFYRMRHMLNFLVFTLGVWALYKIGTIRFGDWRWGLLGALLLVLSPRFFAESFYNGKDIVYMACFTLAIYTLTRLLEHPTSARALIHGLVTALAIDVRVQGLLLLVITAIMLMAELARRPNVALVRVGALYAVAAVSFTFLGWPYLWVSSLRELYDAARHISQYPWPGRVVYFGQVLSASQIPWHYIPVWILITTPLLYTLTAAVGLAVWVRQVLRQGLTSLDSFTSRLDWLFVMWLLLPLLLVMGLHSAVYNGWRHLYFIYPALLLLAVRGIQVLLAAAQYRPQWRLILGAFGLLGSLSLIHIVWRIIYDHPHQQTYFSVLPASFAQQNFDLDYWGLSFRQGLEWILTHDTAASINVSSHWSGTTLLYNNGLILSSNDRARLHFTSLPDADYMLTNYRHQMGSFPDTVGREVHTIRVNGLRIMSVFQRR